MDCEECSKYDRRSSISSYSSKCKNGTKENRHHHYGKRSYSSSSDSECETSVHKQMFEEMKQIKKYYEKCNKYLQRRKLEKALECIKYAIRFCEEGSLKNHKILSKLYSRKGSILCLLEKPRFSLQGFLDLERGYIIDKSNKESRRNMSEHFFVVANKFFRKNEYDAALTYTKHALRLYSGNTKASLLAQKILLMKEARYQETADEDRRTLIDSSSRKCIPEKKMKVRSLNPRIVKDKKDEISSLYKLMDTALKVKNYPRAIIYINLALCQVKDLQADDEYRDLVELKQRIKKLIEGTRESTIF